MATSSERLSAPANPTNSNARSRFAASVHWPSSSRGSASTIARRSSGSVGETLSTATPLVRVIPAHTECSGSSRRLAGASWPVCRCAWLIAESRRSSVDTLSPGVGRPSSPGGPTSARLAIYKETASGEAGSAETPRPSHQAQKSAQSARYARFVFAAVAARANARARSASSASGRLTAWSWSTGARSLKSAPQGWPRRGGRSNRRTAGRARAGRGTGRSRTGGRRRRRARTPGGLTGETAGGPPCSSRASG